MPVTGPIDPDMGVIPTDGPFASAEDLADRWHTLTDEETRRARTLLTDASDIIRDECPHWMNARPATLRRICCQMVKRAMYNDDSPGITQSTQTAGSFSESFTYANPMGDLYLKDGEKLQLGERRQRMWSVDLANGEARP